MCPSQLYFNERITRLIANHLPSENAEDEKFWTGYKKVPEVIAFSHDNKAIIRFISIVASLYVKLLGIEVAKDSALNDDSIKKMLLTAYPTAERQYWQLVSSLPLIHSPTTPPPPQVIRDERREGHRELREDPPGVRE